MYKSNLLTTALVTSLLSFISNIEVLFDISSAKTSNVAATKTVVKEVVKEVIKPVEQTVNINTIEPNKSQPRKTFDLDALEELSASIKQYGIIQPLVVAKHKDYYELIAGERRWRAAKMAGRGRIVIQWGKEKNQALDTRVQALLNKHRK